MVTGQIDTCVDLKIQVSSYFIKVKEQVHSVIETPELLFGQACWSPVYTILKHFKIRHSISVENFSLTAYFISTS